MCYQRCWIEVGDCVLLVYRCLKKITQGERPWGVLPEYHGSLTSNTGGNVVLRHQHLQHPYIIV